VDREELKIEYLTLNIEQVVRTDGMAAKRRESKPMKVIAFNGSPRKGGNTSILIDHVCEAIKAQSIGTEVFQIGGTNIRGCRACYRCFDKKDRRCVFADDVANECIAKMEEADGIILASPTYVSDVTPEIKCLIDRACLVGKANEGMFKRKVGAGVVAVRRGGEIHAFDTLNHFFLILEMIVPGSIYWNMGFGREKGEVAGDKEGIQTMKLLGENMAWLMKKINSNPA
jgi:multimeric flavodoxin WrbA